MLGLLSLFGSVVAQVPHVYSHYQPQFANFDLVYELPSMDIEANMADALNAASLEKVYDMGQVNKVNIDFNEASEKINGADVMTFSMENALSMAFYFPEFHIPEGGAMFIVGEDEVAGPFTHKSNGWAKGDFQTRHIAGNNVQVHYFSVNGERPILDIGAVTTGYRKEFAQPCEINSECIDPVNLCVEGCQPTDIGCSIQCTYYNQTVDLGQWAGLDWTPERRAGVAVGSQFMSRFCSGSFINNEAGAQYVLTAAHCGPSGSDLIQSNFWNPECNSNNDDAGDESRWAGNLQTLSRNTRIDNELLEVGEQIPAEWNVYLAGYESTDQDSPAVGVVGIHHPARANQKISHSPLQVTPHAWNNQGGVQDHWRIEEWTEATTEGGSSGSPLYNRDTKRIIGQLHGGSAACPAGNGWDTYGAVWAGYEDGMNAYLGARSMDGREL